MTFEVAKLFFCLVNDRYTGGSLVSVHDSHQQNTIYDYARAANGSAASPGGGGAFAEFWIGGYHVVDGEGTVVRCAASKVTRVHWAFIARSGSAVYHVVDNEGTLVRVQDTSLGVCRQIRRRVQAESAGGGAVAEFWIGDNHVVDGEGTVVGV